MKYEDVQSYQYNTYAASLKDSKPHFSANVLYSQWHYWSVERSLQTIPDNRVISAGTNYTL